MPSVTHQSQSIAPLMSVGRLNLPTWVNIAPTVEPWPTGPRIRAANQLVMRDTGMLPRVERPVLGSVYCSVALVDAVRASRIIKLRPRKRPVTRVAPQIRADGST